MIITKKDIEELEKKIKEKTEAKKLNKEYRNKIIELRHPVWFWLKGLFNKKY